MAATTSGKISRKFLFILIGIAVIFILISISMGRTSKTEFCMSCHEIRAHKDELEKSSHAVDKDKNPIQCHQCHIPKGIGPRYLFIKTYLGVKDALVHNFGDPEKFDRRRLQKVARRFLPDENCRVCHDDLTKDVKGSKISEIGRLCHEAYLDQNGNTMRGCAGCHFNMAHLPEFDRRFFFNAEFAKRLPLKEEQK
jgi:nitrate/TMAO reductase-like tetraheme cytochrome c subunit